MWPSGWGGPCFGVTLQNCPGLEELEQPLFLFCVRLVQQHRDLLFRPLFRCCRLVIVCFLLFSSLCLFFLSFLCLPLSLSSLCFSSRHVTASSVVPIVCQLACCALSAHHSPSLLPLSLKNRKNPSVSNLFCAIYLPLLSLSVPEYSALNC